jgi:hypothetical protein
MHAIDNAQAAKPILFIMSARVTGQRLNAAPCFDRDKVEFLLIPRYRYNAVR